MAVDESTWSYSNFTQVLRCGAKEGGAIYAESSCFQFFSEVLFHDNQATIRGGAVTLHGSRMTFSRVAEILNCSAQECGVLSCD